MINFEYYSPTKIYFGKNREKEVGSIVKKLKYQKVLLHYGKSSIKELGLYDRIVASLNKEGIEFIELGGVEPNPKISLVRDGIALCKKEKVDLILAVGGGSVIDSAKLIGVGAKSKEDPWEFSLGNVKVKNTIPVGVVLTIAAAGSEMSNSCVISNPVGKWKRGFNSDIICPIFAIMNPEITYSVSKRQTGCGIVDIMMHTIERYFNDTPDNDLASGLSEGLLKSVMKAGTMAYKTPDHYPSRATLMMASSFSHNGITSVGVKYYFTVHKLEHELSGMYDFVAHAEGLSVLFPAWAKYVYKTNAPLFAKFAYNVLGVSSTLSHEQAAVVGINRIEKYFESIGMPTHLSQLGITSKHFEDMAMKATKNNTVPVDGIKKLYAEDIIEIFKLAK
ncbi:MAG: iron-containing alcohol dehydrogenase [Bacilli bacterium]|nr:iron-containing alcohol dehydrogenase [Bacilli bacterium]